MSNFKVGDIVVPKNAAERAGVYRMYDGKYEGVKLTVRAVEDDGDFLLFNEGSNLEGMYASRFKLYTPDNFVVGDKVKVTTERWGMGQFGNVGIVKEDRDALPNRGGWQLRYLVKFGEADENAYNGEDLTLVEAVCNVTAPTPTKLPVPSIADDLRLYPQSRTILAHLKAGKPISPMKALVVYGISRLAACIYDIRQAGYTVKRTLEKDEGGHKYAQYSLSIN